MVKFKVHAILDISEIVEQTHQMMSRRSVLKIIIVKQVLLLQLDVRLVK